MIGVNWWRICNPTTPGGGKKLHEQASFSEKRQLEAQVWTTIMAILVRTCCCGCDLKTGILLIGILGVVSTLLTNDRTHSGQPQTVPKTRVVFTHNVWFFNAADIYLWHRRPRRSTCFIRTYEKMSYRQALRSLTRNNFAGMAEAVKTTPRVSQMVFSVF